MRQIVLATSCVASLMGVAGGGAGVLAGQRDADLVGRVGAGGRPLADVVVWLDAPGAPREPRTRVLEQRNMQFTPRVMAVQVGSTVEMPNNDRVFHNVFSFNHGKRFDLGLYPTGATKRITLDRPAVNRLYCNIHPHMAAYIVAVDSPYFATTERRRDLHACRACHPVCTCTTRGVRAASAARARSRWARARRSRFAGR